MINSLTHSLTFLTIFGFVYALEASDRYVQFPSREELHKCLIDKRLGHFAEKTTILDMVTQSLVPLGVASGVKQYVNDYVKCVSQGKPEKDKFTEFMMTKSNSDILRCLLIQDPKSLQELKELGLYKPNL